MSNQPQHGVLRIEIAPIDPYSLGGKHSDLLLEADFYVADEHPLKFCDIGQVLNMEFRHFMPEKGIGLPLSDLKKELMIDNQALKSGKMDLAELTLLIQELRNIG